jgi:hypothetical protein
LGIGVYLGNIMAVAPKSLEWSLPVPSVQELAIQGLHTVPPRYVRDDMDIIITVPSEPSLRVPLIDMTKLVNPDSQEQEIQRLHSACKEWGLFQVIQLIKNIRSMYVCSFEVFCTS